jgi:hypothetical protein
MKSGKSKMKMEDILKTKNIVSKEMTQPPLAMNFQKLDAQLVVT